MYVARFLGDTCLLETALGLHLCVRLDVEHR